MEDSISGLYKNSSISMENFAKSHFISNQEVLDISSSDDVREFKLVLIGNSSVGKTSIFHKFTTEEFSKNIKSTITAEYKTKYLKVDKNLYVKLVLWDTCGAEMFRSVTKQYYHGAQAIILVFDLTDQKSFNDLKKNWLSDVKNYADKNVEIAIVGNKLDLINERKVTQSQVANFCRENKYKYFETSAKEGTNILRIFEELSFVLATNDEKQRGEQNQKMLLNENHSVKNNISNTENKKSRCC